MKNYQIDALIDVLSHTDRKELVALLADEATAHIKPPTDEVISTLVDTTETTPQQASKVSDLIQDYGLSCQLEAYKAGLQFAFNLIGIKELSDIFEN